MELVGRQVESVELIENAMRLDPFHPDWMFDVLTFALYSMHRYEEAIAAFDRMKEPPFWTHVGRDPLRSGKQTCNAEDAVLEGLKVASAL